MRIVEVMIKEMKMSGYQRSECREIMVSGLTGWMRKLMRRKDTGMYRSARSTLYTRCKKKLLEKTSWYKKKRKRDDMEELGMVRPGKRRKEGEVEEKKVEVEEKKEEKKVKAVMFTTYTHSSILAKKLRESEEKLGELTGYKIKVVERAGTKLVDLLTSSNPWGGTDCRREFCLLCETKEKTGRNKGQDCRKRSCVYEIWCKQCEDEDEMRIDDQYSEEEKVEKKEEIRKKKEEMKRYKYIGETSRSIYERAWEHQNGLASLDKDSYMLKHFLDRHEEEDLKVRRFAVKVIKFTRTSFDRQILESVQLQKNRNHNLLNSKSEFNRCAIPRLSSKLGEKEYKQYSEEEKEEKERSLIIESKIRKIRKEMSKVRRSEDEEEMGMRLPVNKKRRKLETKDEEKKADKEERMESRQRKLMRNWLKNATW